MTGRSVRAQSPYDRRLHCSAGYIARQPVKHRSDNKPRVIECKPGLVGYGPGHLLLTTFNPYESLSMYRDSTRQHAQVIYVMIVHIFKIACVATPQPMQPRARVARACTLTHNSQCQSLIGCFVAARHTFRRYKSNLS